MTIQTTTDNSQRGWLVSSATVDVFLTETGGHMAPVDYCTDTGAPVRPFYISPWQNEGLADLPVPVLEPLRGDFFCLPFGANIEPLEGEQHTVHGETATEKWTLAGETVEGGVTKAVFEMDQRVRAGKVTKKLILVDGHSAVYTSHVIEGMGGRMPVGHHSILRMPEREGAMRVSVGEFEFGRTPHAIFSDPKNREYQSLAVGAEFDDLASVPVIFAGQEPADCTRLPAREGYTDLVQLLKRPSDRPAWTAAVFLDEGFMWYCLKCAAVLPSTLFWISNKGRHGPPWDGRNRCLGVEETCSYFADGLVPSLAPNEISDAGFPTAIELSPDEPTAVNLIQGAVRVPDGFEIVREVEFEPGAAAFISTNGGKVVAQVDHSFVETGRIQNH